MPIDDKEGVAKKLYQEYKGGDSEEGESSDISPEVISKEYRTFIEKKSRHVGIFEILASIAGKVFKYPVSEEKAHSINVILQSFKLDVDASDVYSLSILSFVFFLMLGAVVVPFLLVPGVVLLLLGAISFIYIRKYPDRLSHIRMSNAGTEVILSVLYIVIYMRNNPNLERAIKFAADNLSGPLGTDFKVLLWEIETKEKLTLKEALDEYMEQWKEYNEAFVDAIYLIETSLVQKSDKRRKDLLDQALDRILSGTHEIMIHYVNDLKTPISAVFMLGITMPIMGLVMLPMLGAFLSDIVSPSFLFLFYNIVLPGIVLLLIVRMLQTRPSAFPQLDVSDHPMAPPKDHFYLFGKPVHAAIPALIVGGILSVPFLYFSIFLVDPTSPSSMDIFYSLFLVLSIASTFIIFTKLSSMRKMKIREEIKGVEKDFGYFTFQLANRLSEGSPAEVSIGKVASTMEQSSVKRFAEVIYENISKLGLPLKRAIFGEKYGAIKLYPSSLIRSVMRIFMESTEQSQKAAARSMQSMSKYLLKVHEIEEKIKDTLSDVLSNVKFQSMFIAPIISGIVVGLTSMIMIILSTLSNKISGAAGAAMGGGGVGGATSPGGMGGGASMMGGGIASGFFNVTEAIPLHLFQLVVGIYLVEIVIISTILASRISKGKDRVSEFDSIAKSLAIAVIIYFFVALGVSIAFEGMAKLAVTLGEFS